jgi:hypothetical protein
MEELHPMEVLHRKEEHQRQLHRMEVRRRMREPRLPSVSHLRGMAFRPTTEEVFQVRDVFWHLVGFVGGPRFPW